MKLISHMISISYSKEEDISMLPKGIKIDPRYKVLKIANITKLPKEEYEDRTILGEESILFFGNKNINMRMIPRKYFG